MFLPAGNVARLRRDAVRHLIDTFFDSSTESAVVALLGAGRKDLTREQLDRISDLIDEAKKQGDVS